MSGQFELGLLATGQAAANLLPVEVCRRLVANHLRGRQVFYAMGTDADDVMVWAGRGQRPRWVQDWLNEGGTLDQLAATLDLSKGAAA